METHMVTTPGPLVLELSCIHILVLTSAVGPGTPPCWDSLPHPCLLALHPTPNRGPSGPGWAHLSNGNVLSFSASPGAWVVL